jgi:hypothetical protein
MENWFTSNKNIIESDDNIDEEIDAMIMDENFDDYQAYLLHRFGHTSECDLEGGEAFRAKYTILLY